MARMLLLSPPYVRNYMRNARCDYVSISQANYYPLWLAYAGALLEKRGHTVQLIDAPVLRLSHEETLDLVREFQPDWTVVYASTKSQDNDIRFGEMVKQETGSRLVYVGPFVSIDPAAVLAQSEAIDAAVIREFDYPLVELADGWEFSQIKNLFYRLDGQIVHNEIRPLLGTAELDEIPFVTAFYKRHLNIWDYKVPQQLYPFVDLLTGRGCAWGRCTFCLWVHTFVPGPVYNLRSIDNVIAEFRFVVEEMPEVKEIFVQDDMLTNERARELSQGLLEAGIRIPWTCYAKANLDAEVLRLMKRAGCRMIHVGYESLNRTVLKNIKKGASPRQYETFTRNALEAGLEIHGDFLLGAPGETRESMRETLRWAKRSGITTAQFEIINTYPTLPLYEQLKQEQALEDDEPSYPHLSREEIRAFAKRAFAEFYFRPHYLKKVLTHPRDYFLTKLGPIGEMCKSIFFRRWKMGGGWTKAISARPADPATSAPVSENRQ
ncbi:MAG: radical SAM protein [Nitrospinota bacterium]|nr:MAG: radical SAM protein [Nitrospinota bacterium]